ncbi:hypothetical protein Y1Q_0006592 [Alligator mississippiensis]|uniref:Uncharacterized protein n=1 Tax=Alligator mississippiensis TaxID=8496 RepID=A0A151NU17_ALLMI|nr:hypothetical protein Y1Q_0006592 [Alligator mississippiensis]
MMSTAHPASKDVGEAALVVNKTLQNDGEIAFMVDECLDVLRWAGDGDVDAVHGSQVVGEAYAEEASNHILRVDEVDAVVGRDILDDQAHLPECLPSCVLAHTELVGDVVETAEGGQLHDSDRHLLLQTHVEGLDPPFVIPGAQANPFPPVAAGGANPELDLVGLEVVLEHPGVHGILDGLVVVGHVKVVVMFG